MVLFTEYGLSMTPRGRVDKSGRIAGADSERIREVQSKVLNLGPDLGNEMLPQTKQLNNSFKVLRPHH